MNSTVRALFAGLMSAVAIAVLGVHDSAADRWVASASGPISASNATGSNLTTYAVVAPNETLVLDFGADAYVHADGLAYSASGGEESWSDLRVWVGDAVATACHVVTTRHNSFGMRTDECIWPTYLIFVSENGISDWRELKCLLRTGTNPQEYYCDLDDSPDFDVFDDLFREFRYVRLDGYDVCGAYAPFCNDPDLYSWVYAAQVDEPDDDKDGVSNDRDNCTATTNGPLSNLLGVDPSLLCDEQEDGDFDGYGNPCDFDANNDGATGADDLSDMIDNVEITSTNPVYDMNCDGAAGLSDLSEMIDNASITALPGPSGLSCAGSIPCTAP